jgi:hypothetical protein
MSRVNCFAAAKFDNFRLATIRQESPHALGTVDTTTWIPQLRRPDHSGAIPFFFICLQLGVCRE